MPPKKKSKPEEPKDKIDELFPSEEEIEAKVSGEEPASDEDTGDSTPVEQDNPPAQAPAASESPPTPKKPEPHHHHHDSNVVVLSGRR